MAARQSKIVSVKMGSRAGIRAAEAAEGFEPAPGAKKGQKPGGGDYGAGDLKAARSGELSKKMQGVFARDNKLDPGVEVITRKQPAQEKLAMVRKNLKEGQNAILTKNGAVQVRDARGRIVSTPAAAVRGKGGRFRKASPGEFDVKETRVTDPEAFRDASDRRAGAIGSSLFGSGNVTPARRVALLAALQRDREARGWKGVPDLE